jgi:MFS transporter, NNP family, nitrate/nitrite transporter
MKVSDLKQSGHAPSLLAAFLHFDISFMVWVILGALMPFIVVDIPMNAATKLALVGTPLLAAGAWRLLLGALADRYGSRIVGICSLAATLIPLALGWFGGRDHDSLVVIGLLLGIAGASFAVALPLASRWYPPHLQGLAMGIAGAGNSGTVLATLFAPLLAKSFGWHAVFGIMMIPVGLVLILFTVLAKDPPHAAKTTSFGEYLEVLKSADAWWLCLFYFVTFGGFVGISSFCNTFFVDQYGVPKASVGLWTWPFILAGSFLRPVGGALSDRLGGIKMLTLLYGAVAAFAFLVGLTITNFSLTAVLLFGLMGCLGMGNGAVFQLVPQRFKATIGAMTGLVGAAGGVGGYYLNVALGQLKDATGTYASGFWAFAGIAALALIVLQVVSPGWTRAWLGAGGVATKTEGAAAVTAGAVATVAVAADGGRMV